MKTAVGSTPAGRANEPNLGAIGAFAWGEAVALFVAGLAWLGAAVAARAAGGGVVSDDDFARVVIAQAFAQQPRLDPSGTSWLPAPFWGLGAVMRVFGATLDVARAASLGASFGAGALVFVGARVAGLGRAAALLGAALPACAPLVAVLAAATVPEAPTAALVAFSLLTTASRSPHAWWAGALAALIASLSRYEAWSTSLLVAATHALAARRDRDSSRLMAAALAAVGPALWVALNHVAHGDATRFLARVSAYGTALGDRAASSAAYPAALLREAGGVVVVAAVGGWLAARRGVDLRVPALGVVAQVVGLSFAAARGGAPTHHPERAIVASMVLVSVCAASLVDAPATEHPRRPVLFGGLLALAIVWGAARASPTLAGLGPRRTDELALGIALRGNVPAGARVVVFPEGYGHFATEVALGRPGDLVAAASRRVDPRSPFEGDPAASVGGVVDAASLMGARFAWLTSSQIDALGVSRATAAADAPGGALFDVSSLARGR